jgi:hypothetical protein
VQAPPPPPAAARDDRMSRLEARLLRQMLRSAQHRSARRTPCRRAAASAAFSY